MIPPNQVTQRDLARMLGISYSTVSLALRDSPKIALKQRERIRKAAEEMGYHPNAAAAALAHYKRNSTTPPIHAALAWLNVRPNASSLYEMREFSLYWSGALACAEKYGYRLEEFCVSKLGSFQRLQSVLHTRGIEGIILPPPGFTPDWEDFGWSQFSVVRLGNSSNTPQSHIVTSDQPGNALLALNEIRRRGYKRVGLVTGLRNLEAGASWSGGFLQAQQFIDESDRLSIHVMKEGDMACCERELVRWIKDQRPDAIFTDLKEVPIILRSAGLRVPADIGLAVTSVFDTGADAGIHQNAEEIGRAAVVTLLSLMKDGDKGEAEIGRKILIAGKWVDGKSLPWRA